MEKFYEDSFKNRFLTHMEYDNLSDILSNIKEREIKLNLIKQQKDHDLRDLLDIISFRESIDILKNTVLVYEVLIGERRRTYITHMREKRKLEKQLTKSKNEANITTTQKLISLKHK